MELQMAAELLHAIPDTRIKNRKILNGIPNMIS